MKIAEAYPYIIGKKFTKKLEKQPLRCTQEIVDKFVELCGTSTTAALNLKVLDKASSFIKYEQGISKMMARDEIEEAFYAYKAEKFSPVIPSKYLYLFDKIKKTRDSFNLLPISLTKSDLDTLFAEGTLEEGYSVKDVICAFYNRNYTPISDSVRKVNMKTHYELLISNKEAIALLPLELGDCISDEDAEKVELKGNYLTLGNIQLRFLSPKYLGVIKNIYDYRSIM